MHVDGEPAADGQFQSGAVSAEKIWRIAAPPIGFKHPLRVGKSYPQVAAGRIVIEVGPQLGGYPLPGRLRVHGEVAEHLTDPFAAQVWMADRLIVAVQLGGPKQAQPEPIARGDANCGWFGCDPRMAKAPADGKLPESHRCGRVMITAA